MTTQEHMITIFVIVLGTQLTRALPFLLFPENKPIPKFVDYLGKVLPLAALGLLMVYGLKDIQLLSGNYGIPEIVASLVVVVVHLLKRQILLSIASGTIVYMLFVQVIMV